MNTAKMDILVGLQWGDEGKGKFIDHICPNYDIVARFNGGANAGHTIFWNDKKITLKQLPSGIFYSHIQIHCHILLLVLHRIKKFYQ